MKAEVFCDTSSAIEMRELNEKYPSGAFVTPRISDEMKKHASEIPNGFYDSVKVVRYPNDGIRYKLYWTCLAEMNEKKRDIDPVSQADLELMTAAVSRANEGIPVDVLSEDTHILKTMKAALKKDYRHLRGRINIRRAASMCA